MSGDIKTIKNSVDQGIIALVDKNDYSQAITQDHKSRIYDVKKISETRLLDILDSELNSMRIKNEEIIKSFKYIAVSGFLILALVLLSGSVIILLFTGDMKSKIDIIGEVAKRISEGSLHDHESLRKISGGELGDLAHQIEEMRLALKRLVNEIKSAVRDVAGASNGIVEQFTNGNSVNKQIIQTITILNAISIEQNQIVHESMNSFGEVSTAVSSVKNLTEGYMRKSSQKRGNLKFRTCSSIRME